MFDNLIHLVEELGFQSLYAIIVMSALRPTAMMFGFYAMGWAFGPARMMRITIGLVVSFPLLVPNFDQIEEIIRDPDIGKLILIAPKEFIIGFALGLMASSPFRTLEYAGAISDHFRGENDSGITDPNKETLSTSGMLYLVIGFSAFFSFGGLWMLIDILYQTYTIWPIGNVFPTLNMEAGMTFVLVIVNGLVLAAQLAIPLLAGMIAIEFSLAVAARIAKRFSFYDMAFPIKNLGVIMTLPLITWFVWLHSADISDRSVAALESFRSLFE